jgi:hypothetical protein
LRLPEPESAKMADKIRVHRLTANWSRVFFANWHQATSRFFSISVRGNQPVMMV